MSIKDDYFVQAITKDDYEMWLMKKHYAHRIPSVSYAYGLYTTNRKLQGVCTFGLPPAENVLLCCGQKYKHHAIELNRLIKDDGCEKNVQSWFVAQCFKYLPKPMVVISYSDPNNGHYGYTYQALNFMYTGEGGESKELVYEGRQFTTRHLKDYWFKSRKLEYDDKITMIQNFRNVGGIVLKMDPKKRYVIFLGSKTDKTRMKKLFKWPILPYPKGQNKRYDASYEPKTQNLLF